LLLGYEKTGLYFIGAYAFLGLGIKLLENYVLIISYLLIIVVIVMSIYAAHDTYNLAQE